MFSVGRCAQIVMAAFDQIYYVGRQTAVEILAIRSAQCYTISENTNHAFGGIFLASYCSSSLQYLGIAASSRRGKALFAKVRLTPNIAL